jgi:pyrroloquinoline-quinone synthase
MMKKTLSYDELKQAFLEVLEVHYHHRHPFNQRMHRGELSKEAIQGWVLNRFYYQRMIPVKDAYLLAKLPWEYRKSWVRRIVYHDGQSPGEGGLERWLALGEAVGLSRDTLLSGDGVLPGVRFAVDAYVNFVRDRTWLEGVASSLTELYSPRIMEERLEAFLRHYPWVSREGLGYFESRVGRAPDEAEEALSIVLSHATTPETQSQALEALRFKCQVLWALLDAVERAYG